MTNSYATVLLQLLCVTFYVHGDTIIDLGNVCNNQIFTLSRGSSYTINSDSKRVNTVQTCSLRFVSSTNRFLVKLSGSSYIRKCGVELEILAGSLPNPTQQMSEFDCIYYNSHHQVILSKYLKVKLNKGENSVKSGDYSISLNIQAVDNHYKHNQPTIINNTPKVYYPYWGHHLSKGIIAAIVVSAVITLLCCLAIPIGLCCYRKRRSTTYVERPVVYSADPRYNTQGVYGQPPAYMARKI